MKILFIIYDNNSYIHCFPIGVGYIASALREKGHEVIIYNQDVYHYPEEHLIEYLNNNKFDVVGVSIIAGYYQYNKLLKISAAINSVFIKPIYIIGGHGPSPEPEYFLRKTGADIICIGEGELTSVELINTLANGGSLHAVKGIAFLEKDKLVKTEQRDLISNINSISFPAYDLFPIDYYSLFRGPHIENSERCLPIISGRGCPFRCNFCYRMDKGFRSRSTENLIEEIKFLKNKYNITYFTFVDELLMSSIPRTKELCQAFIDNNLNIKWNCNGRLNFAYPEVLELMKKAGCVFINYGIECMDDNILKVMNKALTVKQIIIGIENTLRVGISPGFNIIFGNVGEDEETLRKGVDFLLKYDDGAQLRTIRPVTPYPGSDLYYYAIKNGLLKDVEDFYEHKHTNSDLMAVNFTKLSDDDFYRVLYEANKKLLENYYQKKLKSMIETIRKLYIEKDTSFRGFRQI
jgi:radical SAM superfamily enzyme YgiQ (UPF0313 family)